MIKKLFLTTLLIFLLIGNCFADYDPDFLTGGTASVDIGSGADNVVDNNEATYWNSLYNNAFPHWWKYDLGVGVTKTARKLRVKPFSDADGGYFKDFTLEGSNNDSDWTTLYTGQHANDANWEDYTFANSTAYRYYRINTTTTWNTWGTNMTVISEVEMMEIAADVAPVGQVIWIN